jgi:hypothetical protein
MSSSSPDDLTVAFRSISRRQREAQGDAPDRVVAGPRTELDSLLGRAATLLDVRPTPDEIADAIQRRPASEWSDQLLDSLRATAMEIGAALRRIETLAEQS